MDAKQQKQKTQEDEKEELFHPCLDVYSIRQGSLRLRAYFISTFMLVFVGLYSCITAVLNYNQADSDQRDMVENMRVTLPGRFHGHATSRAHEPEEVMVDSLGLSLSSPLEAVDKSRDKLSDPRLLIYSTIVHPMVMMRVTDEPITWRYHIAELPAVAFPPFGWKSMLNFNISYKIDPDDILHATQMFNFLPEQKRPSMSYKQTASDNFIRVWNVVATFREALPAYRISKPDLNNHIKISYLSSILVETSFRSVDVPATYIETDAASPDFAGGRPVFATYTGGLADDLQTTVSCETAFDMVPDCRETKSVPYIHSVRGTEYTEVYSGDIAGAREAMAQGVETSITVRIQDLQQPKPYTPRFTEFGRPFFVGFSLLIVAVIQLFVWWLMRFHFVNKHVRENEGQPPLFFQGMRRYRGW